MKTAGPVHRACEDPEGACTYTPDVAAVVVFSDLQLVTADSATVFVEVLILPQGGMTEGYSQTHQASVARRDGSWVFVGSRMVEES